MIDTGEKVVQRSFNVHVPCVLWDYKLALAHIDTYVVGHVGMDQPPVPKAPQTDVSAAKLAPKDAKSTAKYEHSFQPR